MSKKLTEAQLNLINLLPASASELADEFDITKSGVRDRISRIRERGVQVLYDGQNRVYFLPDQPKVRRVSTKDTGKKTREANDFITEVERNILRRIRHKDALVQPQQPTEGNEDMVLHMTDLHIGDVVEDQFGNVIYNTEIAKDVVDHITQKTIELKYLMANIAEFDTLHLLWGGDMITNENIYDGQAWDVDSMLADQMSAAVEVLTRQVKSFCDQFDVVNILAQPGNHGKTRASGVSKQANMDLVTYRWIDDRLREAGLDNLNYITSESTWYRTFTLRNGKWKGFLTHGQDSAKHADSTAASSRDWRGWLNEINFDIAYRGHYHESRREPVQNGPMVYESPSPKPPSEWVSRIGMGSVNAPAKRLATVHGSSDNRPVTWEFIIDDTDMKGND